MYIYIYMYISVCTHIHTYRHMYVLSLCFIYNFTQHCKHNNEAPYAAAAAFTVAAVVICWPGVTRNSRAVWQHGTSAAKSTTAKAALTTLSKWLWSTCQEDQRQLLT